MDPLSHTLTGACLAEAGFTRTTTLATATLLIAANLPDIDGACYLVGSDFAFGARRGWSHGILAMLFLPGLVAWSVMAWDTHVRRRRHPELEPAKPWPILAAAIAGVLSHIGLDWVNNYGVRLLMPFEDRWFYGDTLFIADPWLWLFLGAGVMFTWTRTIPRRVASVGLVVAVSAVLLTVGAVANPAKAAWFVGLAGLVTLRFVVPPRLARRAALAGVIIASAYIVTMIAGSRLAEARVRALAQQRQWNVSTVAAMPVPAQPLRRQVIAVTGGEYLFIDTPWYAALPAGIEPVRQTRGSYDAVVDAALNAPSVQGVRRWLRFPSYGVTTRPDGTHRVIIRDARFAVGNRPGFGVVATVDLDKNLVPIPTTPGS